MLKLYSKESDRIMLHVYSHLSVAIFRLALSLSLSLSVSLS